ncbi:MAG: hypothetical protein JWO94_1688, partial [Verrucomicrobiaceae bacterium]|nr:hypothetical protein [Verrucomicrobiaceae bacterium]
MSSPSASQTESTRLAALHRYEILDTPAEAEFDELTLLASQLCQASAAFLVFVGEDRQWFKSVSGLGEHGGLPALPFCTAPFLQPGLFTIADLSKDGRFLAHPLVAGPPHLRFYAGAVLESEDGHPIGVLGVLDHQPRGLTAVQGQGLSILARQVMTKLELRLCRQRLRSSEERFLSFMAHSPVACWIADVEGGLHYASPGYYETFGIKELDVTGRTIQELFEPSLAALYLENNRTVLRQQSVMESVEPGVRWDGTPGEFLVVRFPVTRPGRMPLLGGIALDTTERKKAEEIRHESEMRFRSYFEMALHGIAITSPEKGWIEVNDQLCSILGYSRAELIRMTWSEVTYPDDLEPDVRQFDQLLAGDIEGYDMEKRYIRKDGRIIWTSLAVGCVRTPEGRVSYVVAIVSNIDVRKGAEIELREALAEAQRFRKALDQVPAYIYMKDPASRYIYANQPTLDLFGCTAQELAACEDQRFFPAATSRRRPEPGDARVIKGEQTAQEIDVADDGDGGRRVYWDVKTPIYTESGGRDIWGLLGIATDITANKEADEALRQSEQRFRQLAENINDVFWITDPAMAETLYISPAYERVWGRTCESLYQAPRSWLEAIHPEDRERVTSAVQAKPAAGEYNETYRILWPDGTLRWVQDRGYPVRNEQGEAYRMVGTAKDITERRLAEDKLREQATLLDKAQDAIIVRGLDHHIHYWNRSAERLYGWTAEEAIGRSIKELLYRDPAPFLDATQTVLAKGEWIGEIQQWDKNGRTLAVECRWTLVKDDLGSSISILAINTDVTERKNLMQQLLRAQRMESIGTLAGGIAHDLNNVLAPIMMSIDLLRLGEKDPQRQAILGTIEGSAKRGADMVRQVLSFARGVAGQRLEVQPAFLLGEIEKIVHETFPKSIRAHVTAPPDLWSIQGDPTQLHQVLLNLCVNARDAMPGGGGLTITAENVVLDERYTEVNIEARPGRHVMMEVADTGSGIPPEVLDRIFEPFFTTKELGKGTGLGLSSTLAIIKSHGGFIRVYSEVDVGTKFRVYLPALTVGGPEDETPAETELP